MILSVVTFIYFISFILYLLRIILRSESPAKFASLLTLLGFIMQTLALVLRWRESYLLIMEHMLLTNFYESLIFFAWMIILIYLLIEWLIGSRASGVFTVPLAFLAMAYASFSPDVNNRIEPLIPALKSNWLTSHIFACFTSYAAFAVTFGFALLYLLKNKAGKNSGFTSMIPDLTILEQLICRTAIFGLIFLTMGIVIGSIWAHHAWDSYWNWDPKETWALVTWFIYAVMIYSRYVRKLSGKRLAVIAVIGFVSVLFTYLGINYFPSLHSYFG